MVVAISARSLAHLNRFSPISRSVRSCTVMLIADPMLKLQQPLLPPLFHESDVVDEHVIRGTQDELVVGLHAAPSEARRIF